MQRGERGDISAASSIVQPFASEPHNPFADSKHALCRRTAEQHKHLRRHEFDLPREKRCASLDFFRCWRAVPRWPPIDDISNVDAALVQSDRGQHTVEQLPCAAY